ncbi:hypothetical protein ACTWLT_20890 [Micromonospora sp. ZYX-F-536]|uniref:hypothetical protein n=1 Tax=Micromonospora sp. ZYX-F-536 TaxID=3457629 RepID=UPI004040A3DA
MPLALFFAFLAWSNATKDVVEAHGGTVAAVRNWAISGGSIILVLSYLLPMKTPTAFHVVRAAAAILVIIGSLITHNRVSRRLAEPAAPATAAGPAGLADDVPQQRQSVSPTAGTPLPAEPQPEDWNAALWDPEVQRDIERRRRQSTPPA